MTILEFCRDSEKRYDKLSLLPHSAVDILANIVILFTWPLVLIAIYQESEEFIEMPENNAPPEGDNQVINVQVDLGGGDYPCLQDCAAGG